ncbi:MAG: Mrp/NBP35 family ATP-binding protein [Bacteroidales bacterium]|nr:Mrp/NBP35 family ATP-binding protein [Bacteroidales bacterium]
MTISENQVRDILQQVIHPASGKSIVETGIVKNVIVKDNKIVIELKFENPNDPLKNSIKRACETILKEKFQGAEIEVDLNQDQKTPPKNPAPEILSSVKNIVAVASGKGGVGKSTVAVNLAVAFAKAGFRTGLIDADIFGPSIPKMLQSEDSKPYARNVNGRDMIIPVEKYGVKVLSIGFFVDPEDATIWRGPLASNALKQLMTDADWGELDYMFIDLPPGTSDIHLTLVQTVPVTGAVIVSTPQNVALADAIKGINMFANENINVPVLGLIENMSWFTPDELPDKKYYLFGRDGCKNLAAKLNVPFLGQIPIVQSIMEAGDTGVPSVLKNDLVSGAFKTIADNLVMQVTKRNTELNPTEKVLITHGKKH